MIVLVTGDRKWDDLDMVASVLSTLPADTTIVHGYANGADMCAHVVAEELGFTVIPCPAHWSCKDERWLEVYGPCEQPCEHVSGRPAGAIRNRYMLRTHTPALVFAFHNDLTQSRGTKDMVEIARRAKVPVRHYSRLGMVAEY